MQIEIDGARFRTLEEFFDEVTERLIPGTTWGRNLGVQRHPSGWFWYARGGICPNLEEP